MANINDLDGIRDGMVELCTVPKDNSIKDYNTNSNVLLFQLTNNEDEYLLYRGTNNGNIIGISASSAGKLSNNVKIFGQDFNGTRDITGVNIDVFGNISNVKDINMNGNLNNSNGHAIFKTLLIDSSDNEGFLLDSSNNKIRVKDITGNLLNVVDISANTIKADSIEFTTVNIKDVSFNNVSVSEKLDSSAIHLDSSIISYKFYHNDKEILGQLRIDPSGYIYAESEDEDGNVIDSSLINDIYVNKISVTYDTVDELFEAFDNDTLIGKNLKGATFFVNKGLSSNNVKETFIINNDDEPKLIPTTPYLVFDADEISEELDAKLERYNYKSAGIMIFQHAYSEGSQYIDIPEGTKIEDGTAITGSEYHKLWQAVKEIQYVLGIDLDTGNISNTTDPNNIEKFGLRNIPTDVYGNPVIGIDSGELISDSEDYINTYGKDSSTDGINGVLLTNLYVNQKTSYKSDETEDKPAFLVAIDQIIEEENEGIEDDNTDEIPDDENQEGGTPDSSVPEDIYVPDIYDEITKDIDEISKYFTRAIRIKRGKYSDLMKVADYILPGELIWCEYDAAYPAQSYKLFIKSSRAANPFICINSGNAEDGEGEYLTELKDIQKIDWKTDNGSTYRTIVDNDGNMHMQPLSDNTEIIVDSGKARAKFYINSFYLGGLNSNKLMFRPCSHNYIELSNLTGKDINLEDAKISLQYTDRHLYNSATGKITWEILPLKGTIKSGETFLIRGAECGPLNCNTTRIEINDYDMEWYDSTGKLISFDIESPCLVLFKGDVDSDGKYASCTKDVDDIWQAEYLYSSTEKLSRPGVYDCIGIRGKVNSVLSNEPLFSEVASVKPSYESIKNTYDVLFIKYFAMDNCAQGTIAEGSRNNSKDIYLINLNENYEYNLEKFYPGKATFNHKNIFYNKSDIGNTPEMIACSFGKQASDDGNGATRCFNWISKGYYNEYLELTYPDGTKKYYESFKNSLYENIYTGQDKEDFICEVNENERFHYKNIYDRYRTFTTSGTPITVHKLIIDNLMAGEYKYKIGRKGFWSEEYSFNIKTDEELINNGFTFVHHSDQQGFNKNEYFAWKRAADFINLKYGDVIDFTVNTGDMTQNGNRISEWLDYYDAGKSLFKHTAQMNTVGNNDLSPQDNTVLGTGSDDSKINPKNFDLFYCHDLSIEEQDILTFEMEDHSFKLLPACYSVDYGNLHLVSINSEVTWMTIERLYNNHDLGTKVEEWLDKDFKKITDYNTGKNNNDKKWIITYCHEMPFTILTQEVLTSTKRVDRSEVKGKSAGCHWNYIPSTYQDGTKRCYWLSRLLEKYHVPLMLGGHKHTYSTSARIKENIKSETDYTNTYKPIIQLSRKDLQNVYGNLSDDALKQAWYTTGQKMNTVDYPDIFDRNICNVEDIEIVDEFDAPMYVMTQATGYKVISNKENAGRVIPWLSIPSGSLAANTDVHSQTYYPVTSALKVNNGQLYPTFIVWNISKDKIVGIPMKMSTTVDAVTSQIYYTGNKSADGLFRLVNETDYDPNDMDNWKPDNVDGMSSRKQLIITNKPF